MKKILCLLAALVLTLTLLSAVTVSAAGSANISANKTTVTVGDTVTVTAKYSGGNTGIGSIDAYFHYNAKVFTYVSCSGATAAGGAGTVKMSYFSTEAVSSQSVTLSVTLKAIAVGSGDFKWETEGMYDDDDTLLGTPGKSLSVSANNPTLSGDATLSYLRPSKGTLSPKFDKNVTEYTVSVPYTVTRGLLNYSTSDPNATTEITANADLKVGKNTRVITVTAPNGTTKKYTVVITREAEATTATTTGTGTGTDNTTATTLPTPAEDALEVTLNGVDYLIADTRPSSPLPEGFEWETVELGDVEIPAGRQTAADLTLLYLYAKEDLKQGAYYLYDPVEDSFQLFQQIKVEGGAYILHNLTNTETGPAGTLPGTFVNGSETVSAYLYEDEALADFVVLQLTSPEGVTGLYTYDKKEGTLQRYHTVTLPVEDTQPSEDADNTPTVDVGEVKSSFVDFVEQYQNVILICAAAVVALAILIIVVVMVLRMMNSGQGRH